MRDAIAKGFIAFLLGPGLTDVCFIVLAAGPIDVRYSDKVQTTKTRRCRRRGRGKERERVRERERKSEGTRERTGRVTGCCTRRNDCLHFGRIGASKCSVSNVLLVIVS